MAGSKSDVALSLDTTLEYNPVRPYISNVENQYRPSPKEFVLSRRKSMLDTLDSGFHSYVRLQANSTSE
jgi:hypothetical protein